MKMRARVPPSPAAVAAAAFRSEVEQKDREMRAKEHKSLQSFDCGSGEDASDGEATMCAGGGFASPSSSQTGLSALLPRNLELKMGTVDRIQAILATGAFARLVEEPVADDSIPSDPMPTADLVGKSHDSERVLPAHPRQQIPRAMGESTPQRSLPPSCLAHFPTPGSTVSQSLRTPGSDDSRRLAEADETFALDSSSAGEQEEGRALGGSGSSSPAPVRDAEDAEAPPRPPRPAGPASPAARAATSAVASPAGSSEPESRSAAKALREMMASAEARLQRDFDHLHAFAADCSGSEAEEEAEAAEEESEAAEAAEEESEAAEAAQEGEDEAGMAEDEAAEGERAAERRRLGAAAEAAAAEERRRVEARRAAERRRRDPAQPQPQPAQPQPQPAQPQPESEPAPAPAPEPEHDP